MKKSILKIVSFVLIFTAVMTTIAFAIERDKEGHVIETVTRPTAPAKVDPDQISVAITKRSMPRDKTGTSSNVIAHSVYDTPDTIVNYDMGYTVIRHTPSIANLEEWEYEIKHDQKTGRIKLLLRLDNDPMAFAKSGFFKVNGKTFYFDDDGLMVLGPAKDSMGCEYFFSYETGELLYEG